MATAPLVPGGSVLVVDFGGQYAHLIARRVREAHVFSEIRPYYEILELDLRGYSAIVLSGSHRGVLDTGKEAVEFVRRLIDGPGGAPILGICYGHQLLAVALGGSVRRGCSEYGRTRVRLLADDPIFRGWGPEEAVWMSHGDCVDTLPSAARLLAISENGCVAAFSAEVGSRKIYGVQFHPEVAHTPKGQLLINNFLDLSQAARLWTPSQYYGALLEGLAEELGDGKVVAAVSGGIDSTVAAALAKKVVGDRLVPVFVDHGLFREGEPEEVVEHLRRAGLEPITIDAQERFLARLEGIADCEARRLIIGEEFAKVFDEVMEELGARTFVQGTTYPDVVESGATLVADRIKAHHNVAGLPGWFRGKYRVVEPLRLLYKDEVRALARLLGLPEYFVKRHPFPGPGLAARILGPFSRKKLEICRRASKVIEDVLREHELYDSVWQAFAVVGDDKWVGVKGDARKHGYVVIVRVVESQDAMTADYARLPYEVLDEMSRRIAASIDDVTMVAYAIASKPPSTIEPC
ncbi:MAG: glutamine-hydrolyzing GMP synthase [Desulfurococcaceae archaeon]